VRARQDVADYAERAGTRREAVAEVVVELDQALDGVRA
jgi:hypothetical protein